MKRLFVMLMVFVFAVSISAQSKKDVKVPEKVKTFFEKNYPNVKDVKWGKEGSNEFEAEFNKDGKKVSVIIDAAGNLKETETSIEISQLPKGVSEYVAKNYKNYNITEAAKIVNAKGDVTFEAQITQGKNNKDLMFTSDGKPIEKKEVKNKEKKKDKEEENEEEED